MRKTRGELAIEEIMGSLPPESERYKVLATARAFKSSWVALGERLLRVKRSGLFQEWGYDNFEEYCAREIRIKKPTAHKLTLAYDFLEREEPQLVPQQGEISPTPDYRSVELLRQAREEKGFSDEDYAGLRRAVLEENRSHPTVQKRFKEVEAARQGGPSAGEQLRAVLLTARRLASQIQQLEPFSSSVPADLSPLIFWLEEQLEKQGEKGSPA
ncbi:hypothetical protein [Trichloromonas sp.]|uniref:hypothetical protein n=1 Tax=Trichloromonas sp. TaxID=3069249 RepID=UPI002A3C3F77|nr:hypothetical protein [Trichloromonas sp.]